MKLAGLHKLNILICALVIILPFVPLATHAQSQSGQELAALVPDEQELQGFICVIPQGEFLLPETWFERDQKWERGESPAMPVKDDVALNLNADQLTGFWRPITQQPGKYSLLRRCLWSTDGVYQLEIRVMLCDSAATAHEELEEMRRQSQIALAQGTFSSPLQLGDESWVYPTSSEESVIRGRYGKLLFTVAGQPSQAANRSGTKVDFPAQAVESVAYQILLKASQQPDLTGISAQDAQVAVNGHALPKGAMKVAGRVYVPVREFARAMGMTSRWNNKTGALTLSGAKGKTVALTAGSAQAKVGGAKAAALAVPVLKSGGQPVMLLEDLVRLTGGRITGHAGNGVQVKG